MASQDAALRKRQQIANANRMMFLWVAGISALVGIAVVLSIFLVQKAWFNEKVLGEKSNTAATLRQNVDNVEELEKNVRVLNTNEALRSAMASGEGEPVQVVLDALPSEANSSALGSSLEEKFLNDNALTIESLNVDPVYGVESDEEVNVEDASTDSEGGDGGTSATQIDFRFSVSTTNINKLKELMQKMERSIRAIDVQSLNVESQDSRFVLTASGRAFYEPARTVELKDKTVEP